MVKFARQLKHIHRRRGKFTFCGRGLRDAMRHANDEIAAAPRAFVAAWQRVLPIAAPFPAHGSTQRVRVVTA
jgi:hypothetical protein